MEITPAAASGVVIQPSPLPLATPALLHVSTPAPKPEQEQIKEAIEAIERYVAGNATNLQFSVDDDSGRTVVTVVEAGTRKVIRQIPTEEVLEISRALDRMQGLLLNSRA